MGAGGAQHATGVTPLVLLIDTRRLFTCSLFTLSFFSPLLFLGRLWNLNGLCFFTSLTFQGGATLFSALLLFWDMEGKKLSFVDELFPQKETAPSSKSDILCSIFPPSSSGAAKDCSHYEASGVMTGRKLGGDGQRLNEQSGTSGGSLHGSLNKTQNISKKNNSPVMLCEIAEPCLMSSSVHYGGRDDFISDSSSSHHSGTSYNFKKDNEDNNSDIATRGEWWQGSYYY